MLPRRLHVQVQTLYYLGPAGTGRRKRTAAAAAQQGTCEGAAAAEAGAAEAGAAEAGAADAEEAVGKKGAKRSKKRKKGAAAAAAATGGKENSVPGEELPAGQKSGTPPPADQEVRQENILLDPHAWHIPLTTTDTPAGRKACGSFPG